MSRVAPRLTTGTPKTRERPIIFSSEMVRAILDGRKTQTRRIIDLSDKAVMSLGQRKLGWTCNPAMARVGDVGRMVAALAGKRREVASEQISVPARHPDDSRIPWDACGYERVYCPYGDPGDRLWVRENFRFTEDIDGREVLEFQAGGTRLIARNRDGLPSAVHGEHRCTSILPKWRPSIHMPRWASRITLELTEVRVERLRDISEEDAQAEGAHRLPNDDYDPGDPADDPEFSYVQGFKAIWERINGPESWNDSPWVWVLAFRRLEGQP